ncbi:hypothetical protein AMAG_17540, partial [Allomyces macrogynus ATCC 38327]
MRPPAHDTFRPHLPAPAINGNPTTMSNDTPVLILVKLSDGRDFQFPTTWRRPLAHVDAALRARFPGLQGKRLRLVHGGSILGPSDAPLQSHKTRLLVTKVPRPLFAEETDVVDEVEPARPPLPTLAREDKEVDTVVHDDRTPLLVDGAPLPKALPDAPTASSSASAPDLIDAVCLHCAVSDPPPPTTSSAPGSPRLHSSAPTSPTSNSSTALTPPRGFDLLSDSGFSPADIAAFRREFHALRGSTDASPDEQARLEDQWMEGRSGANDRDAAHVELSENAAFKESLAGISLGFVLGMLVLLVVVEPGVFSRRQQIGMVVGVVINAAFGVLW